MIGQMGLDFQLGTSPSSLFRSGLDGISVMRCDLGGVPWRIDS